MTDFVGHVYNLETTEGYYIANGLIVHNCRCAWRAVLVTAADEEGVSPEILAWGRRLIEAANA